MPLILGTNSIKDTGYDVANSCRFNRGDSPKMSKTLGTPSDADKFTFSAWVKLTDFGTDRFILSLYTDDNNETAINFENGNSINFYNYISGSYAGRLVPSQKLRDPSSWYHLVAVFDSGNATAGNRMRLYLNGSEITSFATDSNPSQDQDSKNASGVTCVVGRAGTDDYNFGGYMAEVCFCDGQAYAASDFGEFDEDSPTIWKPKDVSGLTFGNNGFYLDFEDSSNLGNDVNGGTDLTEANLAATDQSIDTCTNNFATFNPLLTYPSAPPVHSQGNLQVVTVNADPGYFGSSSTIGITQGKWYAEFKPTATSGSGNPYEIGVSINPAEFARNGATATYAYDSNIWGYYAASGKVYHGGGSSSYGNTFTINDIIGVYLDLDNHKLYFSKNGTIQNSGTGISLTTGETYFFLVSDLGGDVTTFQANFGSPPFSISSGNTDANGYGNFEYDPSSGTFDSASKNFYALNTKNLAEFG
tara:strand:- start:91 stop:1509 length:1419 start_codon:yes stop_codon:yes gene_type:complete